MPTFNEHPYSIQFVYPHTATIDTATASVKLKAPERGDRRLKGRNQTFTRLKNGNVMVYDMGTNMSDVVSLTFELVPQSEFAALMVFLEYVVWGANKIKYIDYKGDEYVVRVYKNNIDSINQGESKFDANDTTLYNFTLDLIDVTNNVADSGQTAVPTQLAIHLADYNHPHNPRVTTTVTSTDGAKVIESISVDAFKHITWLLVLTVGTFSKTVLVHVNHDGTSIADATATSTPVLETVATIGTDPNDITITVDLDGTNVAQMIRLKVAKTAGSVDVSLRRLKV